MKLTSPSRAALLCALLLMISLPASAKPRQTGETLRSLLAKHLKATATPAALHDRATRETVYALHFSGLDGTLTQYDAPPNKSRVEVNLGPLSQINADDGKVAWQQDSTGAVRKISGAELAENRAASALSLESYDPIKDAKKGKVTLEPRREPGTGDYILDLAPVGGTVQRIFLNPRTYLVDKMIATKDGISGIITLTSYRLVNGAKIPSKLHIRYAGLPFEINADLVRARRGIPLSPSLFAFPTVARDYQFLTPTGKGPATVAFNHEDGEVVIPVRINGQTRHFLLDSGAGTSFITASAAQAVGLTTVQGGPAVGYGGVARTRAATKTTLELPDAVRVGGQLLYVIGDPAVTQALSARGGVDGAIGYDLLARFAVRIDYQNKTVTLTDPKEFTPPAGDRITLPIKLAQQTPTVRASVDGKKGGWFLIDTGDTGAVHLFTQYARETGLLNDRYAPDAQVVTGVGVGGAVSEVITPRHRLSLGGVTLTDVPVATITGQGITGASQNAGGIGNQALQKFVVTFDYARGQLYLQKTPEWTPSLRLVRPLPSKPPLPVISGAAHPPARVHPASRTTCTAATAPSMTLQEVLRRHLQALGGADAVAAIKSTRVTAKVETGGITGTVTTVFAVPDKEYEEDKLGLLDIVQGYDGKRSWQIDTNGNTRPLAGDELKNLRNQLYFDTNSYVLPGRMPGKITLRPQTEPGTGRYILDALPEGGKPTTLYLDPHTFLIVKEQHSDDNVVLTTTYSGYQAYDGVLFPTVQHTTNGTARYDIITTATKIENNIAVPDSLFAPPLPVKKFAFIRPGLTSATVPFDFEDGEIAFAVEINGHPERVFLDSGASGIALSQKTADRLHLPNSGILEARGYGGSADLHPVGIASFVVPGAVQLVNITGVAIPLPDALDQFLSHPIAGFVGYDLLSHFIVRVDYGKRQLTFIDPAAFRPAAADGKAVPIELDNDIPSLTAQFDSLPPGRFLVDTGDEAMLRLYAPFVAQYRLAQKYPRGISAVGGGIGGVSRSRLARTQSFTLAGVTLKGIPTDFSLDVKGGSSQINAGSVGSGLLSRFVVTFDYPHSRIFFAPTAGAAKPFDTRTMGITVVPAPDKSGKVHIVVGGVQPESPAAKAGLATFDEVLKIDGRPVSAMTIAAVRRLLSARGGKSSRTLVVQSSVGGPRTIRVSLYDPMP